MIPGEHKCDFKVDEFKKNAGRELYEKIADSRAV